MASPRISSRGRTRTPLKRRQPAASANILSRLLSISSWFSKPDQAQPDPVLDDDDFDNDPDHAGKRRRTARNQLSRDEDQSMVDISQPKAKRLRRASPARHSDLVTVIPNIPAPRMAPGYLDPPSFMLSAPHVPSYSLPLRSGKPLERTMSIDPPTRRTAPPVYYEPAYVPLPPSRDPSMDLSPRPLRIRSTLTPARSGLDFGPQPLRRERDPSEPPPLTALMTNPVFVKPPPKEPRRVSDSSAPSTTLGALAKQRSVRFSIIFVI
jgi:nucleoporin NUP1